MAIRLKNLKELDINICALARVQGLNFRAEHVLEEGKGKAKFQMINELDMC